VDDTSCNAMSKTELQQQRLQIISLRLSAIALGCLIFLGGITFLIFVLKFGDWQDVMQVHWHAIIGIPLSGTCSYIVVTFLRQAEGEIEFDAPGFKFRGASGQIVMWVLCFLAIICLIKMLW